MSYLPVLRPRTKKHAYDRNGVTTLDDRLPFLDDLLEESEAVPLSRIPDPELSRLPVARLPEPPTPYDTDFETAGIPNPYETVGAPLRRTAEGAISRLSLPATSLEADPTLISSRLRMPAPDFVGDFRRTSRMDPNFQRAAMIEQGVRPEQYDSLHRPMPAAPVAPVRDEHAKRGGILGTLKNIGRGALFGLSRGGIGGGLVGAAAGGISPQAMENVDFRYNRMPQYEEDSARYNKEAATREALADRIAGRVGFDPISGRETPQAENLRENRDIRRMQIEQINEDRDRRFDLDEQDKREKAAAVAVQRAKLMGQPVPLAAVKGTSYEAYGGMQAPATPRKPYVQTKTGTDGVEYGLTSEGVWEPTRTADGKPFMSRQPGLTESQAIGFGLQQARMGQAEKHYQDTVSRQERKDREASEKEARAIWDDFEKAKENVTLLDGEKNELFEASRQKPDPKGYVNYQGVLYTPASLLSLAQKKEQEWKTAQNRFQGLIGQVKSHSRLELDESGVGVRMRQGAPSGRAGSSKDPRVGKVLKFNNGKFYRITGIDADGDPVGVEVAAP